MAWKITNENSSKALYVLPGSSVEQRTVRQEPHELWELVPVAHRGSSRFKIRSLATGNVLTIPHGSTQQEIQVVQEAEGDNPGQVWEFDLVGIGPDIGISFIDFVFRIVSVHSQLALDVRGGSTDDHAVIQQYRSNGTPAQRWRLHQPSQEPG